MVSPLSFEFQDVEIDEIAGFEGRVAVLVGAEGRMDTAARRVNRLTKGAVKRMIEAGIHTMKRPLLLFFPCNRALRARKYGLTEAGYR